MLALKQQSWRNSLQLFGLILLLHLYYVSSSSKTYNILDIACGPHLVVVEVVIYFVAFPWTVCPFALHSVPRSPFNVCRQGVLSSSFYRVILS